MFDKHIEIKLQEYVKLLIKWNETINLIAKNTVNNIWERHIYDSAQLSAYIDENDYICDIGSGAGLPGIIISIIKSKNTILIESDSRKCTFLKQASLISSNKIEIYNERIENVVLPNQVDIVTARALTSITKMLGFSTVLKPKKGFLLLKGENFQKELDDAMKNWHFEVSIHPSRTNENSAIIEISDVRAKQY